MLTHREAASIRSMMKRIRSISNRSDMWVLTTKQLDKAWLALMDALKSAEKWP